MPKKKLPYNDRNGYAYVYVNRKPIPLKAPDGTRCKTGTPEALTAYHRFALKLQNPMGYNVPGENVTVEELCAGYVAFIKDRIHHTDFSHYKTVIADFLLPLYADFAVDDFTAKCLKNVRLVMMAAQNKSGEPTGDQPCQP